MARPRSSVAQELAGRIVELARQNAWTAGHKLREEALAADFNVSRSPIRAALKQLERMGMVEHRPNRGFVLKATGKALQRARPSHSPDAADARYLQVAADRLAGRLPEQVSETLLRRRYGLGQSELAKMLARMLQEGWIARRPGYGWMFLPILTSLESHSLSYNFRMAIEPAALMQPTYRIDREAFARCRQQQTVLAEGHIREINSADLFGAGSLFHETIVAGANNPFFSDALKRVNQMRRLIEYRAMFDTAQFIEQAREHLEILDLIESGDRTAAAELLGRHLDVVRAVKLRILGSDAPGGGRRGRKVKEAGNLVAHVHF